MLPGDYDLYRGSPSERFQARKNDVRSWDVGQGPWTSVEHMNHAEIVASILDDLIAVHIWSRVVNDLSFTWTDLFRFVPDKRQQDRVLAALVDPQVQALIDIYESGEIRLKTDRNSLQQAQDLAGCWMEGWLPFGLEEGHGLDDDDQGPQFLI
jgi:hypothetical protein